MYWACEGVHVCIGSWAPAVVRKLLNESVLQKLEKLNQHANKKQKTTISVLKTMNFEKRHI